MRRCPKLLVTSPHGKEKRAIEEVFNILFSKDQNVYCEATLYPGVILIYTSLDSRAAARAIREHVTSYVFRVVPVDYCTETSISNILNAISSVLRDKIGYEKRFYVDCTRRGRRVSSSLYVERTIGGFIVENFKCRVDFSNPDFIVKIEIVGDLTCISILSPSELIVKKARSR